MKYIVFLSLLSLSFCLPQYGDHSRYGEVQSPFVKAAKAYEPTKRDDSLFTKILKDDGHHWNGASYSVDFESEDGIKRSETGRRLNDWDGAIASQGFFTFTFPTGEKFDLKYVADEHGYRPESSWLPVAPEFPHPIPQFVLDQIEKAAREDAEAAAEKKRAEAAAERKRIEAAEEKKRAETALYLLKKEAQIEESRQEYPAAEKAEAPKYPQELNPHFRNPEPAKSYYEETKEKEQRNQGYYNRRSQ